MAKESVEVSIEGFSGPLDLLCHLVESRQMQASRIKVAQLVRIYGAWLAKNRKASLETLADFFFMVAGLLLQKTLSLLPEAFSDPGEDEAAEELPLSEEEFLEKLERYRPYRAATAWLEERKMLRERRFRRMVPEEANVPGEPIYDIGDIFFLSRIWWGLIERFSDSRRRRDDFAFEDMDEGWNGVPEALPEESRIQSRILELEEKLKLGIALSLNALWATAPSVSTLVVTLLAVLEMCRMGRVYIEQETLFADVSICAKE